MHLVKNSVSQSVRALKMSVCALVFLATGCDERDQAFRQEGAGIDLFNESTQRTTKNLSDYFSNICQQAGYQPYNCPRQELWGLLVETGYNDIDVRCDAYLTWIDSKRSERILASGTFGALTTLIGGVGGISGASTSTLAYAALALGFGQTMYDTYNSSLLLGLEGSTIKEVVNRRRAAHRIEFSKVRYTSKPQVIFALRRYLTICTPQSILSDVNTFTRDAANGQGQSLAADARMSATMVPTSRTRAGSGTVDTSAIDTPTNVSLLFEGPGFTERDVRIFQAGVCLQNNEGKKIDGIVGKETISAFMIAKQDPTSRFNDDDKIDRNEWELIENDLRIPCAPGVKNFYEKRLFQFSEEIPGKQIEVALMRKSILPTGFNGSGFSDLKVREAIAKFRMSSNIDEEFPGIDVSDQITHNLKLELEK